MSRVESIKCSRCGRLVRARLPVTIVMPVPIIPLSKTNLARRDVYIEAADWERETWWCACTRWPSEKTRGFPKHWVRRGRRR